MTDRYHTLTVVLGTDIRADDAEAIINAIQQIRGVISASGVVADPVSHMAVERARRDIADRLWRALNDETA
jgi:uncharacterized membrane protein